MEVVAAAVPVPVEEEKRKRIPPTSIQCMACKHWKHPRASKCKIEGCLCDCVKYQKGLKKKRQHAAIEAADGEWHSAQHRRVIHQARFAADCMQKSKAVYAVWVAYMNTNGTVQTDMWGSAPWVEKELGGKTGIVEIIWKAKAMQHLVEHAVDGIGEFGPVMQALKKYNLQHLQPRFKENNIDACAFRNITNEFLESIGVSAMGDRIKLLEAAKHMQEEAERSAQRVAANGLPSSVAPVNIVDGGHAA